MSNRSDLKNDTKLIILVIKWSIVFSAVLLSLYMVATIILWTMNAFAPTPDKSLVEKYKAAAAITGEDWAEMLAFDTVRYKKDYSKADASLTALDLWTIDITIRHKENNEHYYLDSRSKIYDYLIKHERMDLLHSDLNHLKNFFDNSGGKVVYDARNQRDIEDLLSTDQEVEWFNMLLQDNAIQKMFGSYIPLPANIEVTNRGYFTYPSPTAMIVTSEFGVRFMPTIKKQTGKLIKRMHQGLDFAKAGGSLGEPVVASADGIVTVASYNVAGYGVLIKIKHVDPAGNQWETRYGHLSLIDVQQGQKVYQGDVIGKIGNSGVSTGPHLHFEIRYKGEAQNPRLFLGKDFTSITTVR